MSMLGASSQGSMPGSDKKDFDEKYAVACDLFRSGLYADSYLILNELSAKNKHASVLACLALCQMKAEEWTSAYQTLDSALKLIRRGDADRTRTDVVYSKLMKVQADNCGHLQPMNIELPDRYPKTAEETILRIMIDICAETGDIGSAERIYAALSGKKYSNAETAIEKLRQR